MNIVRPWLDNNCQIQTKMLQCQILIHNHNLNKALLHYIWLWLELHWCLSSEPMQSPHWALCLLNTVPLLRSSRSYWPSRARPPCYKELKEVRTQFGVLVGITAWLHHPHELDWRIHAPTWHLIAACRRGWPFGGCVESTSEQWKAEQPGSTHRFGGFQFSHSPKVRFLPLSCWTLSSWTQATLPQPISIYLAFRATPSVRPKIFIIFIFRETNLIKYILKILIFIIYNWYHWKDL